jgi:hypothetical protein
MIILYNKHYQEGNCSIMHEKTTLYLCFLLIYILNSYKKRYPSSIGHREYKVVILIKNNHMNITKINFLVFLKISCKKNINIDIFYYIFTKKNI